MTGSTQSGQKYNLRSRYRRSISKRVVYGTSGNVSFSAARESQFMNQKVTDIEAWRSEYSGTHMSSYKDQTVRGYGGTL